MVDPAAGTTNTRRRSKLDQPARTAKDVQDRPHRQGSSIARKDAEQHLVMDKNGTRRRHYTETQELGDQPDQPARTAKDVQDRPHRQGSSSARKDAEQHLAMEKNGTRRRRHTETQEPENQPNSSSARRRRRDGVEDGTPFVSPAINPSSNPPRASFQEQWEQMGATIRRGTDNALPGANQPGMKNRRNRGATERFFFQNILYEYRISLTILFVFFLLWYFNPMGWLWVGFQAWRGGQELIDRNERNRLEAERIFAPLNDVFNPRIEFLHG
ncbi:hypothetical protein EG328_004042 [Venturia inaequalis]|uniref:Uncharacterized protein n=1 Tax=Venturia inaequalis TaxID=5025 RepID=A0A8H3UR83_VENIN|nr:hypothetical protein EG328_004042 [Venturia inaequalis]RDI78213.1 hypothetical protein Vi05172_g11819 [Venturia inaequalis]